MKTLRPTIEREGQRYVDEPVYVEISRANPLAQTINATYAPVSREFSQAAVTLSRLVQGGAPPEAMQAPIAALMQARASIPYVPRVQGHIEEFSHHERVRLRWVKPPQASPTTTKRSKKGPT